MKRALWVLIIFAATGVAQAHQVIHGEDHIKEIMIQKYIRSYAGACPCPYSKTSSGMSCQKNNAYTSSRAKNAYCYPQDIPQSKIKAFKEINGIHSH